MMRRVLNSKYFVATIIAIIAVAIFLSILITVKPRVVGIWQSNSEFLGKFGCNVITLIHFKSDGTTYHILKNADTDEILMTWSGYWDVSGLKIKCASAGEYLQPRYLFNPLTGKITDEKNKYDKQTTAE